MRAVDLFAGAVGFSTGAAAAGVDVVYAANHWQLAVDVHSARHPSTAHECQDLHQADFSRLPDHELLLASPACQGHSTAGIGARAKWGLQFGHHDTSRSTAWAVVSAAEAKRPEWLLVENVVQFRAWTLFGIWTDALRALGYRLEVVELDAADFGVPQQRRRLFVCGRLGNEPDLGRRLPRPAAPRELRASWAAMRTILDVDGGPGWKTVASRGPSVRERIRRSRLRHGSTFLTQHVKGHHGRSLDRPLPTITTGDQLAIVRGDLMRTLTIEEQLAGQGFPRDYFAGLGLGRREAGKLIGNAVAVPVARALVEQVLASSSPGSGHDRAQALKSDRRSSR